MRLASTLLTTILMTSAAPALAGDYSVSAPATATYAYGGYPATYEVRKYLMEDRRAYGGPGREYILITPGPPQNVIYVHGPRGTARVVIDDRPPIWHPGYIPVLK